MAKIIGKGRFSTTHSGKTTEPISPGMQTLTSIWRRRWSGRMTSMPLSILLFLFSLPSPQVAVCVISGPIRAQNASFRAVVCLLGSERCARKFWSSSPTSSTPNKNWNFGAWVGLSSLNDKKIILITWKLLSQSSPSFYMGYAPRMSLRRWYYIHHV